MQFNLEVQFCSALCCTVAKVAQSILFTPFSPLFNVLLSLGFSVSIVFFA